MYLPLNIVRSCAFRPFFFFYNFVIFFFFLWFVPRYCGHNSAANRLKTTTTTTIRTQRRAICRVGRPGDNPKKKKSVVSKPVYLPVISSWHFDRPSPTPIDTTSVRYTVTAGDRFYCYYYYTQLLHYSLVVRQFFSLSGKGYTYTNCLRWITHSGAANRFRDNTECQFTYGKFWIFYLFIFFQFTVYKSWGFWFAAILVLTVLCFFLRILE